MAFSSAYCFVVFVWNLFAFVYGVDFTGVLCPNPKQIPTPVQLFPHRKFSLKEKAWLLGVSPCVAFTSEAWFKILYHWGDQRLILVILFYKTPLMTGVGFGTGIRSAPVLDQQRCWMRSLVEIGCWDKTASSAKTLPSICLWGWVIC